MTQKKSSRHGSGSRYPADFSSCGYWSKPWHLVNPKIAGKWVFIPLELIIIGFDPPPCLGDTPWNSQETSIFSGWWLSPTPPKNISQLGWWHSQYIMEKWNMFQTTNQFFVYSSPRTQNCVVVDSHLMFNFKSQTCAAALCLIIRLIQQRVSTRKTQHYDVIWGY